MSRTATIRLLGSGTSAGVPIIGCSCPVCTSADPHDNRLRPGVWMECDGFALELDVSPDFRQQALRYRLPRVDAVLVTHCHADHVLGLDELRRYNTLQKSDIALYARDFTMDGIERIFDYIAHPKPLAEQLGMYRPHIAFHRVADEPFDVGPFRVRTIEIPHGPVSSTAVEVSLDGRRFVFASDCSEVTPALLSMLRGADLAMLDALRDWPHAAHLSFAKSIETLQACSVARGRLVHLGHDVLHEELLRRCEGTNVRPGFDGECFEL